MVPARTNRLIADIEILRAVAVLFTIGQHLGLLLVWRDWAAVTDRAGFWAGVDLFFCISGFVIVRSLRGGRPWAGLDWGGFGALALPFWIRRIFRILPSAWLWLALTLAATAWFNRSGAFGPLGANLRDALSSILQLANLHWLGCLRFGVGQCNMTTWVLGAYWSLSLEEQFYVLLPIALILIPKRFLPGALAIAALAQMLLARPLWTPLWAFRTDALLLGAALGLWEGCPSYQAAETVLVRHRPMALALAAVGLPLLVVVPTVGVSCSTGFLALVCAGLVFVASYGRDCILGGGGPLRGCLLWIGTRSYAIYLIHLPVFSLTREIWFRAAPPAASFDGSYTWRFLLTAAILVTVLAEANYRLIEVPLRRYGRRLAKGLAERRPTMPQAAE